MAQFVAVVDGYVNLDHVEKIEYAAGGKTLLLFAPNGRVAGKINYYGRDDVDVELLTAPVVPAAPGAVAVLICAFGEEVESRPDQTHAETVPIIAWRLAYGGAIPVLIDTPTANEFVLIPLPAGRVLLSDDSTFSNLDAAREYVLRDQQRAWEERQKRTTPA